MGVWGKGIENNQNFIKRKLKYSEMKKALEKDVFEAFQIKQASYVAQYKNSPLNHSVLNENDHKYRKCPRKILSNRGERR